MTNVVFVMSDEHNPRFSSTYGHRFVATPQLDRGIAWEESTDDRPISSEQQSLP